MVGNGRGLGIEEMKLKIIAGTVLLSTPQVDIVITKNSVLIQTRVEEMTENIHADEAQAMKWTGSLNL